MTRSGRRLVAALALAVACALSAPLTASPAHAGSELPPAKLAALKKTFNAKVKPLGLRITRALLQNIETYRPDPEGTHLALYVEPIRAGYSDTRYVENFTTLTRRFIPAVFDRWPALESFDICQEPVDDAREVPPPTTQIFVARTALGRVSDWRRADLEQLLAASPRVRDVASGYFVYFAPELRDEPTFAEAAANAGWTPTDTET